MFDIRCRPGLTAAMSAMAVMLASPVAHAQPSRTPNGYTWGELALLPEYCRDVQGVLWGDATNASPRAPHWISLMGIGFWHMHHYCRAMTMVRRAQEPGLTKNRKGYLLEKAKDDYVYTIQNVPEDMPLLPEVLLKYGEALLLQDDLVGAKEAFEKARHIRPDYWPAYVRWIDVQMSLRQFDQARALAKLGLEQVPDQPELKKRLAALQGKSGGAPVDSGKGQRLAQVKPAAMAASAASAAMQP